MTYDHTPNLRKWAAEVTRHFGSIAAFPDRDTIEIQLRHVRRMIPQLVEDIRELGEFDLDTTRPRQDLSFLQNLETELVQWWAKREKIHRFEIFLDDEFHVTTTDYNHVLHLQHLHADRKVKVQVRTANQERPQ